MKTKTVYVCQNCNSDNVEVKAWVKPNKKNEYSEEVEGELGWCCDEELHAVIDVVELNDNAKVIGFQVVGEQGSKQEGKLHPDVIGSFCIYSLSQVQKMLMNSDDDEQWQLLTIWDTGIEKPTMMFNTTYLQPRD